MQQLGQRRLALRQKRSGNECRQVITNQHQTAGIHAAC